MRSTRASCSAGRSKRRSSCIAFGKTELRNIEFIKRAGSLVTTLHTSGTYDDDEHGLRPKASSINLSLLPQRLSQSLALSTPYLTPYLPRYLSVGCWVL